MLEVLLQSQAISTKIAFSIQEGSKIQGNHIGGPQRD